ncbi:MAG: hypothetical protein MUF71_07895 [Candidatus Kapabacteria bacterium]|nr:hypothetical protein [Candidatus Kapabacteria bacterium]
MPVTLDLPPHILETARKYAASEGISLDVLVARTMEIWAAHQAHSQSSSIPTNTGKFGRMPGVVAFIADDFDALPEGFEEYV